MKALGLAVPPRDMVHCRGDTIEVAKPTIAAVSCVAYAGGWMVAQACDLCVASTTARFAITEVKVGRGSPWAAPLIHMIPQRIMMEIILTGKPINARLADLYGLTPSEAEVARLLALGRDTSAIAHDRGLSPATVRTYYKRIFEKTGAARQAELVALIHLDAAGHA